MHNTYETLQKDIAAVAERLNADPLLSKAALLNPLLALNELGYELNLQTRLTLEDRARFPKKVIAKRMKLREAMFHEVDRAFDPGDAAEVGELLFERLGLGRDLPARPDPSPLVARPRRAADPEPLKSGQKMPAQKAARTKNNRTMKKVKGRRAADDKAPARKLGLLDREAPEDPLEILKNAHPVMSPLLEYRQLDASTPGFASAELYTAVREGRRKIADVTPRAVVTGRDRSA